MLKNIGVMMRSMMMLMVGADDHGDYDADGDANDDDDD